MLSFDAIKVTLVLADFSFRGFAASFQLEFSRLRR